KKDQAEKERINLAALKDAATAEVQRLKDVEADRLKDESVRTALIAEQARRKRELGAKKLLSAPPPTIPVPVDPANPLADAAGSIGGDSSDDAPPTGV